MAVAMAAVTVAMAAATVVMAAGTLLVTGAVTMRAATTAGIMVTTRAATTGHRPLRGGRSLRRQREPVRGCQPI